MLDTKENGLFTEILDKEKEGKYGQMAQCMKDGGKIIKLTAEEDLFMRMEMFMMVNGSMIKLME
jgi:hypothetical protein